MHESTPLIRSPEDGLPAYAPPAPAASFSPVFSAPIIVVEMFIYLAWAIFVGLIYFGAIDITPNFFEGSSFTFLALTHLSLTIVIAVVFWPLLWLLHRQVRTRGYVKFAESANTIAWIPIATASLANMAIILLFGLWPEDELRLGHYEQLSGLLVTSITETFAALVALTVLLAKTVTFNNAKNPPDYIVQALLSRSQQRARINDVPTLARAAQPTDLYERVDHLTSRLNAIEQTAAGPVRTSGLT